MRPQTDSQKASLRRRLADPDRAIIGGVSRRLALLTVGSLVALVVIMLAIVFITTRTAMQQSLRDTLAARALIDAPQLAEVVEPRLEAHEHFEETAEKELTLGGVFITVANTKLQIVAGATALFAGKLPDPTAARTVLTNHAEGYTYLIRGPAENTISFSPRLSWTSAKRSASLSTASLCANMTTA